MSNEVLSLTSLPLELRYFSTGPLSIPPSQVKGKDGQNHKGLSYLGKGSYSLVAIEPGH